MRAATPLVILPDSTLGVKRGRSKERLFLRFAEPYFLGL